MTSHAPGPEKHPRPRTVEDRPEHSTLRPGHESVNQCEATTALVTALQTRGLTATFTRHGSVLAKNPAGEPAAHDRLGQLMSPGLKQEVVCRPHGADHELWWFWAWTGPARKSPPELEPLCPIQDVEHAAERIARVLAVPFTEAGS